MLRNTNNKENKLTTQISSTFYGAAGALAKQAKQYIKPGILLALVNQVGADENNSLKRPEDLHPLAILGLLGLATLGMFKMIESCALPSEAELARARSDAAFYSDYYSKRFG